MAETVVSFVLEQLSIWLREEGNLLGGLREEVQHISDELGYMKAFLRVAEAKEEDYDDPRLREWIKQVRGAAYDIEDVLSQFILQFAASYRFNVHVFKFFKPVKRLRARHKIASKIKNINSRLEHISESRRKYESEYVLTPLPPLEANNSWPHSKDDAVLVEESKLVGIDEPKEQLIYQLLDNDSQLKVVAVVGMGGLGKTTLVKRVYEDVNVRRQFQIRVWMNVSQKCNVKKFLRDLIRQLCEQMNEVIPAQVGSVSTDGLKSLVKDLIQKKRYVIVFDDVWEIMFWDEIKFALPRGNFANRVIFTTRIVDVATASCIEFPGFIYKMKPLSEEESWTLFCNRTFKDNCCPAYLSDVSEDILSKCEGLPLAIIAISGVLALKDNNKTDEWEMVLRSIGCELEGNGKLDRLKKILSLSYNELPYYLKSCLCYASIFPEDYLIQCERLTQLWIAEGFVQEMKGLTTEEVALRYLNELINRSLIQVGDAWRDGRPITFRMHDLLRKIVLAKSSEQSMMTIASGQRVNWPEKVRRLVIHNYMGDDVHESSRFKYLRSLITFGSMGSLSKSLFSEILSGGSMLLKVLDMRGAELEEIPGGVFKLFHLKYLNLRGTGVKIIPQSIGKLQNLAYLDLAYTSVTELPMEIIKLKGLRRLTVFRCHDSQGDRVITGFKAPYRLGKLLSLQNLCHIEVDDNQIILREIGKLVQLRELGITKLRKEDGKKLCSSLRDLKNLRDLYVSSVEKDEIIDLDLSLCSALRFLRRLYLKGRLEKVPEWLPSLHGLTRIDLSWSQLRHDPIESLQNLPNLVELFLYQAYQGEELIFKRGGFQKLKMLVLCGLKELMWIGVEEGAMPNLQRLYLSQLKLLMQLPWGIHRLAKLEFLDLDCLNEVLISNLLYQDKESEDHCKIAHIPEVFITEGPTGKRWRRGWTKEKE